MEKCSNKKLLKKGTENRITPQNYNFKKQKEGEQKEMMNKRRLLIRYN